MATNREKLLEVIHDAIAMLQYCVVEGRTNSTSHSQARALIRELRKHGMPLMNMGYDLEQETSD